MPKRKAKSKAKDIVARSITLKDSKGKIRLFMGVGGATPYSSICLFGDRGRSIELSADHEGGLYISLHDGTGKIAAALGITSDDRVGLSLFDHRSGTRTQIGSDGAGLPHYITLHHHGKVHWTTRKPRRKKSA
jgi:hypothetical protein